MGFASHRLFATVGASFAVLLVCRALIGLAEAPSPRAMQVSTVILARQIAGRRYPVGRRLGSGGVLRKARRRDRH